MKDLVLHRNKLKARKKLVSWIVECYQLLCMVMKCVLFLFYVLIFFSMTITTWWRVCSVHKLIENIFTEKIFQFWVSVQNLYWILYSNNSHAANVTIQDGIEFVSKFLLANFKSWPVNSSLASLITSIPNQLHKNSQN